MAAVLGYTVLGIFQTAQAVTNTISTVVGAGHYAGDGGPATSALLKHPTDVAIASSGDVYVVDRWNSVVRKVDTSGTIVEADDDAVTIRSDEAERRVAYPFIRSARTVFEWGPKPKPGKQKHGVSGSRK